MSLTVLVRDTLESWPGTRSFAETAEFLWLRLERILQSCFQYVFLGGWARQLVELPILVPQLAQARTWIPTGSIQFSPERAGASGPAFLHGLQNAFFLGLPLTLSHLLVFKRYSLQGIPSGLTARVSYRGGEVLLLCARGRGVGAFFQQREPLSLLLGLALTALVVSEAIHLRAGVPLLQIAGLHFAYAFVEQGVLFASLGSQTLDTAAYAARLAVGPGARRSTFAYGLGLFSGGLRVDALFLSGSRFLLERIFLRLKKPPEFWRGAVEKGTSRLIVALALAALPFYSADYLSRNLFGFSSRDSELSKLLSRFAFSIKRPAPGEPVSVQFEGRNILSPESYGRTAPDVIRDPWHRSTLSIEAQREGIEETYATRSSNQKVDAVYLGSLERTVFEWLNRRTAGGQERSQANRETVPVGTPVRQGLGREVAPPADGLRTPTRADTDRRVGRRDKWYRASRARRADTGYAINLPLERAQAHPEGLTALYHTGLEAPRYLAGGGRVEPFRPIRYDSPSELSRKRNARRSPLHKAPVHAYRDWLLSRQPKEALTSALQQKGLYRARLALNDYLSAARRYQEAERGSRGWSTSRRVSLRAAGQRELFQRRSGGVRSRANSVYSQQYTGNLHLVRRLFAVSWDARENRLGKGVRRKLALDQLTQQRTPANFESEELGRASVLRVQNGQNRLVAPGGKGWVLLPGSVRRPDTQIHPQPLYAGFDQERRALVLTNRVLPPERALRGGPGLENAGAWSNRGLSDSLLQASLKTGETTRTRFSVWPRNNRVRRIRSVNTRYTSRPVLSRRRPIREVQLLSRDRATWAKGSVGTPALSQFAFWRNPRSDSRKSTLDITPVRSSQAFPLSFERAARVGVYVPGDLQPSNRGGLLWPGAERARWFSSTWRPGAPVIPNLSLSHE